jgi:hypothetical protein
MKVRRLVAAGGALLWNQLRALAKGWTGRVADGKQAAESIIGTENTERYAGYCRDSDRKHNQKGIHSSITLSSSHLDVR